MNLNVECFQITIDGNKESHNRQRHLIDGKGTYDVILKNLIDIHNCDKKYEILIRSNITKENYIAIRQFLEKDACIFKNDERFIFFFKAVGNWGLGIRSENSLNNVNTEAEINICKHAIKEGYNTSNIDTYLSFNNVCPSRNKNYYVIDVDGKILKCTTIKLYDDNNIIGNIINLELNIDKRKLWEDNYKYDENCLNCEYFPICRGGSCPIEFNNKNKICFFNKKKLREYINLFFDLQDCNLEIVE